jgi:hypothetical protein
MANINYLQLNALLAKKDKELVATCIRLAKENPGWDWSRAPKSRPEVTEAHKRIWNFLQTQPTFIEAIRKDSFIERWKRRGAIRPVTSDHVKVTNQFHLYEIGQNDPTLSLRVSTWNMMNKAHSKANCHQKDPLTGLGLYANTPEEDLDEDKLSYTIRKREQFHQIIEQIKQVPPTDAFFLQEVDFLTNPSFSNLKDEFETALHKEGFTVLLTPRAPSAKAQAVVFNTKIWQLDQQNPPTTSVPGTSVGGTDSRNSLFEVNLLHKVSHKPVCLISAHLDFTGDYSSTLLDTSKMKAMNGSTVIWGGDTNHTPGHQIQGLTGDFHHATNYDVSPTGYTAEHSHTRQAKTYDGFGFCPPEHAKIRSVEEQGERFYTDEYNQIKIGQFTPEHPFHLTLTGQPWMRRQNIILDVLGYREAFIKSLNSALIAENSTTRDGYIKQINEAQELRIIGLLITRMQQLMPHVDYKSMHHLLTKGNQLLIDDKELDQIIQNIPDPLTEKPEPVSTIPQGTTTGTKPEVIKQEGLTKKKSVLLTLREEIINYDWQVGLGGENIDGKKIPRNAAAIYKICDEDLTSLSDKEVKSKFNQVAIIVENSQQSSPLMAFLRKIDFLHLFTRSDDTQNRYRMFNTRIAEAKNQEKDNEPPPPLKL